MKTKRIPEIVLLFACSLLLVATAGTVSARELDDFLDEIDIHASKDMGSFRADLRLNFDVSDGTLDGLFEIMPKSSDVYMCLRVGEIAKQPTDRVVDEYRKNKGQGWGVIAKSLGIKPGSDEFHALKSGDFSTSDGRGGKGKGKSKK